MAKTGIEIEAEPKGIFYDPACKSCGIQTAKIIVESVRIYHQGRLILNLNDLKQIIIEEYQQELVQALLNESDEIERERAEDEAEWKSNIS